VELQSAVETAYESESPAETPHVSLWYTEGDGLIQLFSRTDTILLLIFMCIANLTQSFYIETFADQAREVRRFASWAGGVWLRGSTHAPRTMHCVKQAVARWLFSAVQQAVAKCLLFSR
jgi:hypothetical protein